MTLTPQHPPWTERHLTTPLIRLLAGQLGLDVDGIRVLEVRGRHSGTWHPTPLKVLPHTGQHYLVSLHGPSGSATSASTPTPGCGWADTSRR